MYLAKLSSGLEASSNSSRNAKLSMTKWGETNPTMLCSHVNGTVEGSWSTTSSQQTRDHLEPCKKVYQNKKKSNRFCAVIDCLDTYSIRYGEQNRLFCYQAWSWTCKANSAWLWIVWCKVLVIDTLRVCVRGPQIRSDFENPSSSPQYLCSCMSQAYQSLSLGETKSAATKETAHLESDKRKK